MNFITALIPLAASLLTISANDKHRQPCGQRCGREEADKVVRALQAKLQAYAKNCDYQAALELSLPNASFATTDSYCADNSCCFDVGSMEKWWTYYGCPDTLYYPVAPVSVRHLNNGTVIITQPEVQATYSDEWDRELYVYKNNYHWFPVAGEGNCEFRLGYITANSYNCPEFIPNAISCDAPICAGV